MEKLIYQWTTVFQLFVFSITMYYMFIAFFGLYKKKEKELKVKVYNKFALIVAAHNEEMVIGQIVKSLQALDYPKELYDIFVIADNCTDETAKIAQESGAQVFERFDAKKRGKGYALEWMFEKIFNMEKHYDAVVIFDADNLASRNFLIEMNKKLNEGFKVVQGYIDSKNPHDSWITQAYSISFWSANRLFQLSRNNLGLSNQIGGTGFCVETGILKELGWGATCLTEDLEFTCKLVMNGYKVGWAHEACVYDEKPLTLKQSWNQRKRWMQGFTDVASRYFFKLMKTAIKKRSFVAFDCGLYTVQPFVILLSGIAIILTFIQNSSKTGHNIYVINNLFASTLTWQLFSVSQFLFTPFVMILERKFSKTFFVYLSLYSMNIFLFNAIFNNKQLLNRYNGEPPFYLFASAHIGYLLIFAGIVFLLNGKNTFKIFVWYLLYGFYTLSWIPITIQGVIDRNKKEWSHTKHTRQISIEDIEDIDGRSVA